MADTWCYSDLTKAQKSVVDAMRRTGRHLVSAYEGWWLRGTVPGMPFSKINANTAGSLVMRKIISVAGRKYPLTYWSLNTTAERKS